MDDTTYKMLNLMDQPVILLNKFAVVYVNDAASRLVPEGYSGVQFFPEHMRYLETWEEDRVAVIDVFLNNVIYTAKVTRFGSVMMLVLDKKFDPLKDVPPQLSDVAKNLSRFMSDAVVNVSGLMDYLEEKCGEYPEEAAGLNRCIYRLHRLLIQSRDTAAITNGKLRILRSGISLQFFLYSFEDLVKGIVEKAGWKFTLDFNDKDVVTMMDVTLIRRALFNLLLNAMQHTPKGQEIILTVGTTKDRILFCLNDGGQCTPAQFLTVSDSDRIVDTRLGLGMGHYLIREIAQTHGGTFICTTNPDGKGMIALFSIGIIKTGSCIDNAVEFDHYGGRHPALVELADVLDKDFYHPDKV